MTQLRINQSFEYLHIVCGESGGRDVLLVKDESTNQNARPIVQTQKLSANHSSTEHGILHILPFLKVPSKNNASVSEGPVNLA